MIIEYLKFIQILVTVLQSLFQKVTYNNTQKLLCTSTNNLRDGDCAKSLIQLGFVIHTGIELIQKCITIFLYFTMNNLMYKYKRRIE